MSRGTWCWSDGRDTVESFHALDVRWLHRRGALDRDRSSDLHWRREEDHGSEIRLVAGEDRVTLAYRLDGEPWRQVVEVERTECNYGGARPWWRCPYCRGRAAVLYGAPFACRRCHDLAYTSTRADATDRAMTKARKLVERLGGDPVLGPGPRPKGAHHDRWARDVERWSLADQRAWRTFYDRWPTWRY